MDSACSVPWNTAATANLLTLTLANVRTAQTITTPSYWGCITVAGQVVPAGTYTDTVTMRVRNSTNTSNLSPNGTFSVSITNPATCAITSVANVVFGTYLAFRNTALAAPAASFVMNCTLNLPYTLSLDATSGAMAGVGLNYTLTLSASGQQRGAGPGQTFTITGAMPAGQAGTCSAGTCSGSDTRTLMVTY
jgi:spore coat protein U-like protein